MLQIYCNQCFEEKVDLQRKFCVTECFHVFCESCISNTKKFCLICKKDCKILPINGQLPKEIKNYFDPQSTERLLRTIEKILEFQESQNKLYVTRNYRYREVYNQQKKEFLALKEQEKQLDKIIMQEKTIMSRLKEAYNSGPITPELFQLRSDVDKQSPRSSAFLMEDSAFHSMAGSGNRSSIQNNFVTPSNRGSNTQNFEARKISYPKPSRPYHS